jgi:hypothetical protein
MIRLTLALLLMTPIAIRAQAPMPPTLAFAFELHAEVAPPLVVGDVAVGTRRIVQITGGTFEGPGFKGRVLPGGGGTADDAVAPSRASLVTRTGEQALPVSGSHSQLEVKSVVPQGASLVLAEPSEWVRHARVTVDGRVLAPSGDAAAYALPAGPATISVDVLPTNSTWRYAQGLLLLVVLFMAVPFGNRSSRRRRP